ARHVEWRPLPAGELVTVEPALEYEGHLYRIHYRTWRKEEIPPERFLRIIATSPLNELQTYPLSGLVVTRDGEPVRDGEELRMVFGLYITAYYLYQGNADLIYNSDDLAGIDNALNDVL